MYLFDDGPFPQPDMTEAEVFAYLALTFADGTYSSRQTGGLLDKTGRALPSFLQINDGTLKILSHTLVTAPHSLWKIWDLFEILITNFSKLYGPSEHLAVNEIIVKLKGRVIFKQYIMKKCKHFGIKMCKLCVSIGYTYDMDVYLGKDRQWMAQQLRATHPKVTNMKRRFEGFGHKLCMDNFFPSPDLFDDLAQIKTELSVVGLWDYMARACPGT